MLNLIESFGKYLLFIISLFKNKEKSSTYFIRTIDEIMEIAISSLFLVCLVSVFMGIVTSIQTASNLMNPMTPKFIVGLATRNMTILELSPTVVGIIITGKVGSNIASQLSSMRISEQIDALKIFGINASSYLVLPKILASLISYPMLIIISMFLSILGGYFAAVYVANILPQDYITGITTMFKMSDIRLALYKSFTFAFLMSTISSYIGFHTEGGSLEVGRASTKSFTISCIAILVSDYLIAQLFLKF